jgi:NOL1/NOP2/fmu family ribosome biogenesis protein
MDWMENYVSDNNLPIFELQNRFHMSNQAVYDFISIQQKNFYFRKVGIALGERKGKDFIPDHELSLSNNLNPKISTALLNQTDALLFLKKLNFDLPQSKQGITLIQYKNWGIGWAKLLLNRMNNYLPKSFKILK